MKEKRGTLQLVGRLLKLVRPLIGQELAAITTGVLGYVCATFLTIFGCFALLGYAGAKIPMAVGTACKWMIVFAAARGFLGYIEQYCNHYIAFHLLAILRDKVFGALRRLCPAKLEGRDKGDLIGVITSDIEAVELFYAHTISPVSIAAVMTIIMTVFIGSYHWLAGLIALAGYLTVGIALPLWIARLGGKKGKQYRQTLGSLNGYVLDSLRGLKEILQYGRGADRLAGMNARTVDLTKKEGALKKENAVNQMLSGILVWIFAGLMLFACALLYQNGAMGADGVLICFVAMLGSFGPTLALASLGSGLQQAFAAAGRIMDILDETPQVEELTDGEPLGAFTGAQCEAVYFSYGNEEILSDFSMEVPKDKIVGIVGKSGSGKSTLLKLFMRFWDVNGGMVRLSDRDVKNIPTASLRDAQSYVAQDTQMFHDSIKNNVRLAKPTATDEEIVEACRRASVHDFIITLPKGYDTPVGELGDTLSGGERQRIGLARAFLHDAPFVLLDEPTSNLDSLNEAVILKSLKESGDGKTILLVSHRESTMRIADEIYRVENGRMS